MHNLNLEVWILSYSLLAIKSKMGMTSSRHKTLKVKQKDNNKKNLASLYKKKFCFDLVMLDRGMKSPVMPPVSARKKKINSNRQKRWRAGELECGEFLLNFY